MSKAFDPLHPPLMLSKLRAYGFKENTLNLLCFYLTDRQSQTGSRNKHLAHCEQGMPPGICPRSPFYGTSSKMTSLTKLNRMSACTQTTTRNGRGSYEGQVITCNVMQKRHPDGTKSTCLKETFPNTRPC